MDYMTEIAKQGFGYLLFIGALGVVYYKDKQVERYKDQIVDLANKRVEDLKEARNAYAVIAESQTKVAENTYTIVQNIQNLVNTIKQ